MQDISKSLKQTAETLVSAIDRQVKNFARLITKQPKKPNLSWETIIGESYHKKTAARTASFSSPTDEFSNINPLLGELEQHIFEELYRRIQNNLVDEIQAIRLYEKLFECEIKIMRGHVHFYQCTSDVSEETIDYTLLINRLLKLFDEHRQAVSMT